MIKKILIFLAIALTSLNSQAEWVSIYFDSQRADYADTSSITGSVNFRRITELRNFNKVQTPKAGFEHLSIFYVHEFNCGQRTYKVILTGAYELHNCKGRAVFKDDIPTPTYESFKDGTSTAKMWRIACK